MGLIFSYYADPLVERVKKLEKTVKQLDLELQTLSKVVIQLNEIMEQQRLIFKWNSTTTLYDPKQLTDMSFDQNYDATYDNEYETDDEEKATAYENEHRIYTVSVVHGGHFYKTTFRDNFEYKTFKSNLLAWKGHKNDFSID